MKQNGAKKHSVFSSWFRAQYGPRPVFNLEALKAQLCDARVSVAELSSQIARVEAYDAAERAALYAWQAARTWPKSRAASKARPRKR